jgi:lambda repressor-like predicted transcriptional regulator
MKKNALAIIQSDIRAEMARSGVSVRKLCKRYGLKQSTTYLHLREIERLPVGELMMILDACGAHLRIEKGE